VNWVAEFCNRLSQSPRNQFDYQIDLAGCFTPLRPWYLQDLSNFMALVDLLLKLEDLTQMRIPPGKVQPKDMDTVTLMFATAQRVGRPRK
jgi:hypothetical protein